MTKHALDRRTSARMPVVPNQSRVEWGATSRDGEPTATLLDISRGGASVLIDEVPPVGQPVWFRVESPTVSSWMQAKVVRRNDPCRAALQFLGNCPDDVMLAATLGIALDFGLAPIR